MKFCIIYVTTIFVNLMGKVVLIRKIMQDCKLYSIITIVFIKLVGVVKLYMVVHGYTYSGSNKVE